MSDSAERQIDPLLDAAIDRLESVERAVSHLSRAVLLKLTDVELDMASVNGEDKEFLQRAGSLLVRIAETSASTAQSISSTTNTESNPLAAPQVNPSHTADHNPLKRPTHQSAAPSTTPEGPQVNPATNTESIEEDDGIAAVSEDTQPNQAERSPNDTLYDRLITLDRLPKIRPIPEGEAIEIGLVTDDSIAINGKVVQLKGHGLYLFNALALLRDQIRTGKELRDLGFYPGAKSPGTVNAAFSNSMKSLIAEINNAASVEIIKKIGNRRSTRYVVNPKALLVDQRANSPLVDSDASQNGVKKN